MNCKIIVVAIGQGGPFWRVLVSAPVYWESARLCLENR